MDVGDCPDFYLGRGEAQLLLLHLSFRGVLPAFHGPVPDGAGLGFWGRSETGAGSGP